MIKYMSVLFLLLILFSSGCQSSNNEGTKPYFINIGDKHYLNAWEIILTDPVKSVKFGEVEKSSRVPEGSSVYEIEGYPGREIVAVKDPDNEAGLVRNMTGYGVYVLYEGSDKPTHYPEINESETKIINIFKGTRLIRTLTGDDVQTFISLMDEQGPHNEFPTEQFSQFTIELINDQILGLNYGISEKNGDYGLAHIESKLPAEIARFFED